MRVAENHHTGSNRAAAWLHPAIGPAVLFVIFVLSFWKLVLTDQYTWLEGADSAYQVLPWLQYQAGELQAGRFPLWDPHHWGGQSLIGQAIPGTAYPLNWLLFLMPLKNGWIRQSVLHWYYVIIHFQAGLFCYWLCRDLGRTKIAAILAGAIYGLAGYIGTIDWPQMLNGAVWAPAVFLFLTRMLRGERPHVNAAWSGACLGIAFLSGHHQIPIYLSLAAGGVWLWYIFFQDGAPKWPKLRLALVFGLFLVLLSALQTLPTYEYGKLSLRWVGAKEAVGWKQPVPYHVHQTFAMQPISLLGITLPGFHQHSNPYMGFAAILLALVAVVTGWRDRMVKLFFLVALGGIFLALGHNSVVHGLAYVLIPMVEKARSPNMAILIFNFGASVLVAFGIDQLENVPRRVALMSLTIGATLLVLMLGLTTSGIAYPDRVGAAALGALAAGGALAAAALRLLPHTTCAAILTVIALFEAGTVTGYGFPHRDHFNSLLSGLSQHGDIAEFLRQEPQPLRADVDGEAIRYNFGDWYGIDQFGGYLASLSINVANAQSNLNLRKLFASAYWIGKEPNATGQREVFKSKSGLRIFRNAGALPRAWTVHQLKAIGSDAEIPGVIDPPGFDPRRTVFLKGPVPSLETCIGSDLIWIRSRTPHSTIFEADMKCRGMMILADTWAPGWIARVDGKREPLYEAYSFILGVAVDAGRHRIEILYRPMSVYLGATLTALGALGAILLRFSRVQ